MKVSRRCFSCETCCFYPGMTSSLERCRRLKHERCDLLFIRHFSIPPSPDGFLALSVRHPSCLNQAEFQKPCERGKKEGKKKQKTNENPLHFFGLFFFFCHFSFNYISINPVVESTSNCTNAKCQVNLNYYVFTFPISIFGPASNYRFGKVLRPQSDHVGLHYHYYARTDI